MEDFNEDIPSYEDISASLEAHSSAKYTGSSGDILSGGGRHSYEYYPKYLLDSLEAECAARQGGVVHKLSNCPRTQTSWTDAKVYGQTHGFVDRLSGRGG